ncbi:LacI family DNA-binding transcriptional regulator [uncultured Jatrophihabitans sp.]|uniref:LacI family DNA-binding transcriptional regulator n=1 Tax=uncultured Jatrophihabitans sp. TaxID=1610747 RepID=UPI0035CA79EB
MRDVAARAGVSLKTVSRVLNDEPGVLPAPSTRVRDAALALGYQRNESAAALRRAGQSSRTLGLVIEDVGNPFYAALIKAVERVARPRGYLLVAGSSDQDQVVERQLIASLCARRVEGLLVVPSSPDLGYLADELAHGTAVVALDRPLRGVDVDSVVSGNADGARSAVDHLVALGHRRIGYVGDTATYTAAERLRGYREALTAHALPDEPELRRVAHDAAAAEAATADLLATTTVTALFTGNNLLTQGAIRALGARRRHVALVGFDDFALADLLDPSVTVVAQDAAALGRHAAELLFARIDGDDGPRRQLVLATELIARGSSLPAP